MKTQRTAALVQRVPSDGRIALGRKVASVVSAPGEPPNCKKLGMAVPNTASAKSMSKVPMVLSRWFRQERNFLDITTCSIKSCAFPSMLPGPFAYCVKCFGPLLYAFPQEHFSVSVCNSIRSIGVCNSPDPSKALHSRRPVSFPSTGQLVGM